MELKQLRCFIAVAESGGFRAAADRVFLSQPALTRQIQSLERDLGVTLLTRGQGAVALTAAGEAFLAEARRTLALADGAVSVARRAANGEFGRLAIGFADPAMYGLLPAIVRQYCERHPAVQLELHELSCSAALAGLEEGSIDVAFAPAVPRVPAGLRSIAIETHALAVAVPTCHPKATEATLAVRSLAEEPFIFIYREQGPGLFDLLTRLCQRAGFSPLIAQQVERLYAVLGLVASGLGLAFVPQALSGDPITSGVMLKTLRDDTPGFAVRMIWSPKRSSPTLRELAEVAQAVAGQGSKARPDRVWRPARRPRMS